MNYTNEEAYNVGKRQKAILWLILASMGGFFIPLGSFIVGIIAIFFVYHLATALKTKPAWMWACSQMIPIVGLICLLILNQKATNVLQGKNVRVGLMGGKDIERLIREKDCENSN